MAKYLKPIIFGGLFIIPFIPLLVSSSLFFPFITTKAFVFRVIVEIVFASWILLALFDTEVRPKKSVILYSMLGFLGVIGLSTIFSVDVGASFWSNFERMEGFISMLHFGAFFLVIASVFNEDSWRRWWNTTLFASAIMIVYVLLQLSGAVAINQGGVRVDGTLGNATYLAVYMLFHIFIALILLWRARKDKVLKWIYGILILGQLLVLYYTATRGAILGLLGGLFLVALLNLRNREDVLVRKASVIALAALVVVVGGFVLVRNADFVQKSPVLSRFTQLNLSDVYQGRYYVWPMALGGFKEKPIFGWGQENFTYIFQERYVPEMYNLEPWFDRAHNVFLDWAVAGGGLGLISYLALYAAFLYLIWKSSASYFEKSILVGLIAAYAFHNFFVFDNLTSYILFFALLAYVHQRSSAPWLFASLPQQWVAKVALPFVAIVFLLTFYFWNVKPLVANASLIQALRSLQLQEFESAGKYFKRAYGASTMGRQEVMQHMAANSIPILESNLPIEKRNEFYAFAKQTVMKEADADADNGRIQLVAGGFLTSTGFPDEALVYLERAKALMPKKQQVYIDTGSSYFAKGDPATGLAFFKKAYDLAPNYPEAKIAYILGAIFAGDRTLENKLIPELSEHDFIFNDRILSAYHSRGRLSDVIKTLNRRAELDPANAEGYRNIINQLPK